MKDINQNSTEEVEIEFKLVQAPLGFGLATLRQEGSSMAYDDDVALCSARHPTRWSCLWARLGALPGRIAWAFSSEDHF